MNIPDPETAIRDAIWHWPPLPQLAEFAVERHGYWDGDGGFGVTYPDDLDEYDREVDGQHVPAGYVRVSGFRCRRGEGYDLLVYETTYLETLAAVLSENGLEAEAEAGRVRELAELTGAPDARGCVGQAVPDGEAPPSGAA